VNRRHVAVWALYDFANSVYPAVVTATLFSIYFTTHIVGNEEGLGDLWWGRVISVSMLFVALSSPPLGSLADRVGIRKRMMVIYSLICVGSVALFTTIEPGMILWGAAIAVVANVGFEGAMVFYNAYLPEIAPKDRQGFVSGIGFGTGYAGSAAGLLIALPLVTAGNFDAIWLMVAGFFLVFALPAFFFLPRDQRSKKSLLSAAVEGALGFRKLWGDVLSQPAIRRFLLAFFIYIDGVNTTIYFAGIFAATTLGFDQKEVILLFLVVQGSALVGSLALANPTDRWGPKRVITLTLVVWTAVVGSIYFVESKEVFFVIAVVAGSMLGAIQAASRAFMSQLIPAGKEAGMFGFYAFCGKSSSVVGPLVFGSISHGLGGDQRTAALSVAVFFLVGLLLLQRVRIQRPVEGVARDVRRT